MSSTTTNCRPCSPTTIQGWRWVPLRNRSSWISSALFPQTSTMTAPMPQVIIIIIIITIIIAIIITTFIIIIVIIIIIIKIIVIHPIFRWVDGSLGKRESIWRESSDHWDDLNVRAVPDDDSDNDDEDDDDVCNDDDDAVTWTIPGFHIPFPRFHYYKFPKCFLVMMVMMIIMTIVRIMMIMMIIMINKMMMKMFTCIVSPLHDTLWASQSIWKLHLVVELCDL